MEFSFDGRKQVLRGEKKVEIRWTIGKEQRAVQQAAQLFTVQIIRMQNYGSTIQGLSLIHI